MRVSQKKQQQQRIRPRGCVLYCAACAPCVQGSGGVITRATTRAQGAPPVTGVRPVRPMLVDLCSQIYTGNSPSRLTFRLTTTAIPNRAVPINPIVETSGVTTRVLPFDRSIFPPVYFVLLVK